MTEMKLALVLYTYFCILQLTRETNGEITPPWISSRGCYEWTPGSSSTQLSDNSPKNCFKECANFTHIGIRDDVCVCFANMPTTSRKPEHFCHSAQNIHIYSKVIELPFNISQADYGYVYVSIQTIPSSMIFHASIDSSENHGIICTQDFSWICQFRMGAANNVNGETAKSRCSLFSYFDLNNSCHREDGDYWIGMYREAPIFISVESSTNASTVVLPSTQHISYVSDNTPETFSQTDTIIRSTIKLTPSPITVTSSAYLLTNVAASLQYPAPASPKGEPEDIWKKMDIGNEWTYDGENGPDHWHLDFPHCGGVRQSPVSIKTDEAIVDSEWLVPFTLKGYDRMQNLTMQLGNNGHTVQVDLMVRGEPVSITGGGLTNVYIAQQFHFHWGKEDKRGSEHDIDGTFFPMEMHIVHYNMKYKNFTEALNKEDGLAVLGFFFKVGKYNLPFDRIIKYFSEISHRDEHTQIEVFALRELLPENLDGYYRYYGSLTTPPCYESVIWSIFYQAIEISEVQLDQFRYKVHENYANETNTYIYDDYRPTQCLNRRKIHCSKPVVSNSKASQTNQNGRTSAAATLVSVSAIMSLIVLLKLFIIIVW